MALEDNITTLTDAIRELTATIKASGLPAAEATGAEVPRGRGRPRKTPEPVAEAKAETHLAPEPVPEPKEEVTAEMVRETVMKVADLLGKAVARELVASAGKADKLVDVDHAQYAALYHAAQAKLDAFEPKPSDEDDDI